MLELTYRGDVKCIILLSEIQGAVIRGLMSIRISMGYINVHQQCIKQPPIAQSQAAFSSP